MTESLLRALARAHAEQRIDRRTYIKERRRLIDEAVAGMESRPPVGIEAPPEEEMPSHLGDTVHLAHPMFRGDDE
jgi:hypothetical protein